MRYLIILYLTVQAVVSTAQSKAELETKIKSLQAELEQLKKPKTTELTDPVKRASYGLGVLVANNIRSQGADSINTDAFTSGLLDVFQNQLLKLDQQQCNAEVQQYMQVMSTKKAERMKSQGVRFLATNKTKPGVISLPSGLQYEVITSGAGKSPVASDRVTVHYTGKLIDGYIFDSSVQRGQPATFALNQVIAGWTEAIQLMKEGDKWLLYIPYELGYGDRGNGPKIPPYAALIFEVELIKVN